MKPIPKTITINLPKDIYDEIKKCGYFPSTELILLEDKVEFVSVSNIYCNDCGMYYKNGDYTFCGDCNNTMKQLTFGTHKATLIAIGVKEDYQTDLSEKLHNWIKENFKGSFNMYKLEGE